MATTARSGYWDVERCCWVGAEPSHILPESMLNDVTPVQSVASLPVPRDPAEDRESVGGAATGA